VLEWLFISRVLSGGGGWVGDERHRCSGQQSSRGGEMGGKMSTLNEKKNYFMRPKYFKFFIQ
jgi:hypothetical protein